MPPRDVNPDECTIDQRLLVLSRVPFFAALEHPQLEAVNGMFRAYGYSPGEPIYRSGTPANRLFVVAHGRVKTVRHTAAGQDVLFGILTPGEMFGGLPVLGSSEYLDDAEAQTACCVLGISSTDFRVVLQRNPGVALAVLDVVAARLHEAQEALAQLSGLPVEARVAAALLKLGEKLGVAQEGGVLLDTPISRQDLAAMTGTTTESVSRVMSEFRKQGLIESGRRWIVLRSLLSLAEIAGQSHAVN